MAPNSAQRRARQLAAVPNCDSLSAFGMDGTDNTSSGDGLSRYVPPMAFGEWMYRSILDRAPRFAPVVGTIAVLSLPQIAALLKILKTLRGFLPIAPLVSSEQRFEYADPVKKTKREIPWTIIFTVLSLVSLGRKQVTIKSKYTLYPRYWGMAYLAFAFIKAWGLMEWARRKSPIGARVATKLITTTLSAGPLSSSQQRQVFVDIPLVKAGPTKNHTHGMSAADRNAGSATAALAARALGKEPYYVQKSLSDVRKGRDGDRSYHWAKDVAVPAQDFHFDPTLQAAVLVDVDYYIDMPNLLARFPGTYFISTFQPSATACGTGEYNFMFLEDNRVQYRVSGGAEYCHEVWDYKGDTILVEVSGPIKKRVVSYHIDRKRIDDHHQLVMLTVIGQFECLSAVPTSTILEGGRLERLRPVHCGHVVLDVVTKDGVNRSVSILGQHISVTMPKIAMDALVSVAMVAKVPITPAMVASNVAPAAGNGMPTGRMDPGHPAVLASYIRAGVPRNPPVVYPPSACSVPIYFGKHDYDAPVPLKGFGSPLIGPCYTYATSISSDDRCISGRVEAFVSEQGTTVITPSLAGYMVEFAERLIPVPHLGHPLGLDEIHEHQPRRSQRNILDEAQVSGPFYKKMWRAFVKKETGVAPSDPRNISTATPQAKLAYSSFLYAFHQAVMELQKWYAFNKTPAGCANRVAEILKDAKWAVPSDASRFDGHVKWVARVLERIIMLRFFAPEHHSELNERLDEQVGLPGTTAEGRKYKSGYTRASGSAETSDLNSVDTAFIGYCGWRNTKVNGVKLTPDEAWAKLGVYGGDDSLEGDIDPDALAASAKLMGQVYKTKVILRGEMGVEFLNRQFGPDVWTGDINSMANPSRLLAKLWVGPAHLTDYLEKFAQRASGYYRMDRNSPVVGAIVRVAHELLGERLEGELMPWAGQHSLETNWPNEDSGWMNDLFDKFIPDFDRIRFDEWIYDIRASANPALLLCAPLCTAAPQSVEPVKTTQVVGDDLTVVEPKLEVETKPFEAYEVAPGVPEPVVEAAALVPVLDLTGVELKEASASVPIPVADKKVEKEKKERLYPLFYEGAAKPPKMVTKDVFVTRPDLWRVKPGSTPDQIKNWNSWRVRMAKKYKVQLPKV